MSRTISDSIRLLPGVYACPPDRLLEFGEAEHQFGVRVASASMCSLIAALALHEGEISLTQADLAERTGYSTATVSKAVGFLFRTGVTLEGAIVKAGSRVPASTVIPADNFGEHIEEVPAWRDTVEEWKLEDQLGQIAGDLGLSNNGALREVLAFYLANNS